MPSGRRPAHLDGGGVFALGVEELSVVGSQQRQRLQPHRLLPSALQASLQASCRVERKGSHSTGRGRISSA